MFCLLLLLLLLLFQARDFYQSFVERMRAAYQPDRCDCW
jgi:hypothetical protein